jgi:hypothetical protein
LMPVSLAVLRGGLAVAPSGRHPGGEMHSAKTFCERPQKLLSPPPSFLPSPSLLCPCRDELNREMDLTINEEK